jgi:hypothetical protein
VSSVTRRIRNRRAAGNGGPKQLKYARSVNKALRAIAKMKADPKYAAKLAAERSKDVHR